MEAYIQGSIREIQVLLNTTVCNILNLNENSDGFKYSYNNRTSYSAEWELRCTRLLHLY